MDIQAGASFGYRPMLFVILLAGIIAIVLQVRQQLEQYTCLVLSMSRLGIGREARMCDWSRYVLTIIWCLAELLIV